MKYEHHLLCGAPICQGDFNPNYKDEVLWYPGERVCLKKPYQVFQEKQFEINRLVRKGQFKKLDTPYTANQLENDLI